MILVSTCLLGINCNYKGKNAFENPDEEKEFLEKLFAKYGRGELYPVCPEVMGGLSVPRAPAEIRNGNGEDVINNKAIVVNSDGTDVTEIFVQGAYGVLGAAKSVGATTAILKARSPSCGSSKIYDGTFSKKLIDGDGVAAALLKEYGIEVLSEEEI